MMFVDKQKLARVYLDEITKLGNLLDTINVDYFVSETFAMYSYGLVPKTVNKAWLFVADDNKKKVINILFKLNYNVQSISKEHLEVFKTTPQGTVQMKLFFMEEAEGLKKVSFNNKTVKLNLKDVSAERKEVSIPKIGKGYYRVAPLELMIFLKMGAKDEDELFELEALNSAAKVEVDKLMKLFETNGFI